MNKPLLGCDNLGGNKYPRIAIRAASYGSCTGIFLRTFGDARRTVKAWAKSGKFAEITVHLAPFDGSHNYPIAPLEVQLLADARWLEENVARQFPNCKLILSPFCESNHERRVIAPLFKKLAAAAPSCIPCHSIYKGQEVPGTRTEVHIPNSKQLPKKPKNDYQISFDGFGGDGSGDYPDANIPAIIERYSDAKQIRGWNFRNNGKFGHADDTEISDRECWPDVPYIRCLVAMLKQRDGALTWPNTALYKPMSDDHGGGPESKDNKAMCIIPAVGNFVEVRSFNGKLVDRMQRFAPDHIGNPKGARYYSKKTSKQLGDAAEKASGSRGIVIGPMPTTDADLRSGMFK
jgi:hypothetical protein